MKQTLFPFTKQAGNDIARAQVPESARQPLGKRLRLRDLPIASGKANMVIGDVGWKNSAGAYYFLCPFHNERSPSCRLWKDMRFHCFGCGMSGSLARLMKEFSRPKQLPRPPSADIPGSIPF